MGRWIKRIGLGIIVVLVALQFVPVEQVNPPEKGRAVAAPEIEVILRRACYDCHSNETMWPWYSKIAPASLLISNDVKEGRREVNFSTWEKYDERRKARKLTEIAKEVQDGDMPPWYYTPLHPDAVLSAKDREIIIKWAKQS
jgi:cytochrome c551/c552